MPDQDQTPPPRVELGGTPARGAHRAADEVSQGNDGIEVEDDLAGGGDRWDDLVGGVDIAYDPDDPSDAVLQLQLADGSIVEAPLTEGRSLRLTHLLEHQRIKVAAMRHEMSGQPIETFTPPPSPVQAQTAGENPAVTTALEQDADEADGREESKSWARKIHRKVRFNPDPAGIGEVTRRSLDNEVGRTGWSVQSVAFAAIVTIILLLSLLQYIV